LEINIPAGLLPTQRNVQLFGAGAHEEVKGVPSLKGVLYLRVGGAVLLFGMGKKKMGSLKAFSQGLP